MGAKGHYTGPPKEGDTPSDNRLQSLLVVGHHFGELPAAKIYSY